jgi:autotransporter adhesin
MSLVTPALLFGAIVPTQQASAQIGPLPNVVNACSGVSLPRSVVTDILGPVATGIVGPMEGTLNPLIDVVADLPLVGTVVAPLDIDLSTLLANAAAGENITLQVINTEGELVAPEDSCITQADSFSLETPQGIAIGGNRISGLGAEGAPASAGEINSIAFGNAATTDATAPGAIAFGNSATVGAGAAGGVALGTGASATGANGVAIGANSVASRGPLTGYTAFGLAAPQSSAGEFSVGAAGAERQITNVAAGSAPTDAVNVAQLEAVAAAVGAIDEAAVRYDGADRSVVTLDGANGTQVTNVAPGALSGTSTDAVNGSQLFATNQTVVENTSDINALDGRVTNNNTAISNLTSLINQGAGEGVVAQPVRYSNAATPTVANDGSITDEATLAGASGGPVGLHNVRGGAVAAGSTDAVNGGQLFETNQAVAANSAAIDGNRTAIEQNQVDISDNRTRIDALANTVTGSTVVPVQYSNAATPEQPNGGTLTNDVTLVGAAAAPVGLHNVAAGEVAAGSTDAVNGGQLAATNSAVAANGEVAREARALGANSVQYDPGRGAVTLGGSGAGAPVRVGNVAAGTSASDAVNVGQLNSAMNSAVAQASAYTDLRVAALDFELDDLRRDSEAGTAGALAAAALPQAFRPGGGMVAIGAGTFQGESAIALGASTVLNDGRTVLRIGATLDTRSRAGANAGVGWSF